MSYQYDPVGNVTQLGYGRLRDTQWVQSSEVFAYDGLDRLVSAQGDYGSLTYSYDGVGNRLSQNELTYTYNPMNELLSITDGAAFTYDGNGNTLTKTRGTDAWSYTYDERNSLVQVEKNRQVIGQYRYDGNGFRIEKTEGGGPSQYQTSIYVYSGPDVIYEKNVDTGQVATYVYGPDGKITKNVDGMVDYYHADHLGSTRLITDESGNIITEVSYTPFGESESTPDGEDNSYLYTGKEHDLTGLYYYGARYYDPETGRFTTRDPSLGTPGNPGTLNRYVYCLNNPLKYIDPDGCETANFGNYSWYDRDRQRFYSFFWAHVRSQLMQWKYLGQMSVKFYNWANAHPSQAWIFTGGVSIGAGGVGSIVAGAGSAFSALVTILCATMYVASDQYYADLWNDPQFVELWNNMEAYLNKLVEGYSCEQEFNDACCEISVYLLQKEYGDNWREHADSELLKYYDDMMKRKNSPSDDSSSNPPIPSSTSGSGQRQTPE
ncbi:MAG: RHS repeat-associated core domain-containing protein [Candidatus Methanofastidiosia archaeon]